MIRSRRNKNLLFALPALRFFLAVRAGQVVSIILNFHDYPIAFPVASCTTNNTLLLKQFQVFLYHSVGNTGFVSQEFYRCSRKFLKHFQEN